MDERRELSRLLDGVELAMRKLEIRYEQYFGGVEKREPMKARETLALQIRKLTNRHITQTSVRFRLQNLATRFHSYSGHWDRILRLLDEGKFERGAGRISPPSAPLPPQAPAEDTYDRVYNALVDAYKSSAGHKPPQRQQVDAFLDQQKEKIREKFGDRDVEFQVVTEDGKPKIKVRAKKMS